MHEQKAPSPRRPLTVAQQQTLLHKYLTGTLPPRCRATTIRALMHKGMVAGEHPHGLVVTAQGKAYCACRVMDLRPFFAPRGEGTQG